MIGTNIFNCATTNIYFKLEFKLNKIKYQPAVSSSETSSKFIFSLLNSQCTFGRGEPKRTQSNVALSPSMHLTSLKTFKNSGAWQRAFFVNLKSGIS